MKDSIGSRLQKFKGIGPGFDFLRVALAIIIVLNHAFLIFDGSYDYLKNNGILAIFGLAVPMFFSLSGFLISASAQRLRLRDFLLNRAIRIIPALAVDIFVSSLVIGPLLTKYDLRSYYSGKEFFHYFLNIIGFIHYTLPGVFLTNPFPGQVNGSLWTVAFEIGCYVLMTILIYVGGVRSLAILIIACVLFSVIYFIALENGPDLTRYSSEIANYISNFFGSRGRYLYFYFLGGTLLYFFRYRIPYSPYIFVICVALSLLRSYLTPYLGLISDLVFWIPVSYITAYIGLQPIRPLPLYSRGDYSYGIYLYAYPLQQMLVREFPSSFMTFCLSSVIIATGVAVLSWHLIEKPILGLRRKFSFTAHKGDAKPMSSFAHVDAEKAP